MADGDDQQPDERSLGWLIGRIIFSLFAGMLATGGVAATKVIESRYAIAGLGVLVVSATFRLTVGALSPDGPPPRRRPGADDFYEWRDADIDERNDEDAYSRYRQLRSEAFRLWRSGALKLVEAFTETKERTLDAIINTEARRLEHARRGPVTLAVVEDTGEQFVAKRTSQSALGSRIRRGMSCPHDGPLDLVLDNYAQHHRKVEFHACGHTYYLVALSNEVDFNDSTARALLNDATNEYECTYLHFRWMATSAPPPVRTNRSDVEH